MTQNLNGNCGFCHVTYLSQMMMTYEREQHEELAYGCWTSLVRGVDEKGRVFILAKGEEDSDRYYPKFCPECGRNLQ